MGGLLPPAERGSGALLVLYAAVSVVLLVTGTRIPTASLRGIGAFVFAPLDRVVLVVDRLAAGWRENQRLEQRNTQLELELQRLREEQFENQRLRELLDLSKRRGFPLRPVEFLSLSGEPIPRAATVSSGARQGVAYGDVVVTRDGLVGHVDEVYGLQSRVVLLTDPNAAVACEVESTAVLGIVKFILAPRPRLLLTGVPVSDSVQVGQHVQTSGYSRRYPRGIRVGTVIKVTRDPTALMQDLEIGPAAQFSRLRFGFLVPGPSPGERP